MGIRREIVGNSYLLVVLFLFFLLMFGGCAQVAQSKIHMPVFFQPTTSSVALSPFATAFPPVHRLICPGQKSAPAKSDFVHAQGINLMYQGFLLKFYGYTFYPDAIGGASAWWHVDFPRYIDHILDMGASSGQNMVRPTDFWDRNYRTNGRENAIIWKNLDYLVCTAQKRGVFVNMDVSAFAWFLLSHGHDMFDMTTWSAFLYAVGTHYALQPMIAFYSILGEPVAPKNKVQMKTLVDFYRQVMGVLRNADGYHHLITAGGFNHMEDESPDLPWWRLIYALPTNDIGAFKIYSQRDLDFMATIVAYAETIHKPVFAEEFGMPQNMGDTIYSGSQYNNLHMGRAAFFDVVYNQGESLSVAGFTFWNMGCGLKNSAYEVNPLTFATWQILKKHAPLVPDKMFDETKLC